MEILRTEPEGSPAYNKALEELRKNDNWKEYEETHLGSAKALNKFFKGATSAKIEGLINDEVNSGRLSAEKDKENQEKKVAESVIKTIPEKIDTAADSIVAAIKGEEKVGGLNEETAKALDKNSEDLKNNIKSSSPLRMKSDDEGEDKKEKIVTTDMLGNTYVQELDEDGNPIESKNDNNTKKSRKLMDKFTNSIISIPDSFGNVMDKLFGAGDEEKGEKPGILTRLFDFVGGIVSADKTDAFEGEEITLIVTPNEHYSLSSLSVLDDNNQPITLTNNHFIMPKGDVHVNATFSRNS